MQRTNSRGWMNSCVHANPHTNTHSSTHTRSGGHTFTALYDSYCCVVYSHVGTRRRRLDGSLLPVCLLCPHTSLDTGTQYGIKILHVVVYGQDRDGISMYYPSRSGSIPEKLTPLTTTALQHSNTLYICPYSISVLLFPMPCSVHGLQAYNGAINTSGYVTCSGQTKKPSLLE